MEAHLQRAQLLFGQRRYEQAEKEVGLQLGNDPNNPRAHALMALCLAEQKRFPEATEHAQQAIALEPNASGTYYTLAYIWLRRNDLDKALSSVQQAIALFPAAPIYHALLARIEFARSRWQQALEAAEKALEFDPESVEALNLRAASLRKLGRAPSARDQLHAALRADPDDAGTHANLGWTYLEQGNRKKAMEHFREALRLDPELDWARHGVVETLKAGNFFYRVFLKYIFWMQRFGRRGQWTVILAAYLLYTFLRRAAAANPALSPWLTPLIVAYIVFALATWLAVPLANLALRVHPFGRLALSREERFASNFIGGFLFAAIVAGTIYLVAPSDVALFSALYFGLMVLPLSATFMAPAPWPRKPLAIYTAVLGFLGIVWFTLCVIPTDTLKTLPLILGLPLSLLGVIAIWGFPFGAILSLFAGNILMSIRWKQ